MLETHKESPPPASEAAVAYILKGFPRLSEMFIASEIYRLEQLGVRLRLYVIKPADEARHHGIVERIGAKPDYLPPTASLSATSLSRWLSAHLKDFLPALKRVARRRPVGVARAAAAAFAQAVRARRSFLSWPRKLYLKEFLQAAAIADKLLGSSANVRHLHAHFCHGATTVTWLASLMTGLPFSFTAHAKDIYCESLNPAGLLGRKMRAARFVVTCTDANREHLRRIEPSAAIHCIYHGLNAEFEGLLKRARPTRPRRRQSHLRALGVGRLVPKKGFDVLVEACGILHRRNIEFEAVIVGPHGEHEAELRRRIRKLGLETHIQLTGPMEQSRLYEEYRRASAFCLPCRVLESGDRDGIPNVLMEAMACGLPVITTAVSGIPEIVRHGLNGQLIPPDNAEALADALVSLERDPHLAENLSTQAQATVRERFDGEHFALQLASLFREAVR
ncbi:MAG TPA: glycosyltransferase family 4 protein [Pyrinomonadaceae bacterium]|jgi:glycosyltransferase involved in cell wall biosynthesis|nr:glycosyltransferase family 4 protein [Pyrinomonadaceae bacterium]